MTMINPTIALRRTAQFVAIIAIMAGLMLTGINTANAQLGANDVTVTQQIDLGVATPGDTVTFTITAKNASTVADAADIQIEDPLPGNVFQFVNANTTKGSFTVVNNDVRFFIGALKAGETVSMVIIVKVRADVVPPVTVTNVVILSGTGIAQKTASQDLKVVSGRAAATPAPTTDPAQVQATATKPVAAATTAPRPTTVPPTPKPASGGGIGLPSTGYPPVRTVNTSVVDTLTSFALISFGVIVLLFRRTRKQA